MSDKSELRTALKAYNWSSDKDYQIAVIACEQQCSQAKIAGIEQSNEVLFRLLPTGDVTAWDMLKATQAYQNEMSKTIAELQAKETEVA